MLALRWSLASACQSQSNVFIQRLRSTSWIENSSKKTLDCSDCGEKSTSYMKGNEVMPCRKHSGQRVMVGCSLYISLLTHWNPSHLVSSSLVPMQFRESLQVDVTCGQSGGLWFHTVVSYSGGLRRNTASKAARGSGDALGKHGVKMDGKTNLCRQMCW